MMEDESGTAKGGDGEWHYDYSTVGGYFMQDDPETDPDQFDFVRSGFPHVLLHCPAKLCLLSFLIRLHR